MLSDFTSLLNNNKGLNHIVNLTDIFRPTKFVLEKLFSRMQKNGIILLDDCGEICGATKAIDDFLKIKIKN